MAPYVYLIIGETNMLQDIGDLPNRTLKGPLKGLNSVHLRIGETDMLEDIGDVSDIVLGERL